MGLVAPRLGESSRTRGQTCIPCIGRWISYYWTTREAPHSSLSDSLLSANKMLNAHLVHFANKSPSSQSCGFSSSHGWMWELDYKESWVPKNWCFWTVVLEKTLECPLDWKEIQPVHPKGNQSWIFIGRTDAEAETQYFGYLLWQLTHLKRPWCWERLKAGEGDDRGWDG